MVREAGEKPGSRGVREAKASVPIGKHAQQCGLSDEGTGSAREANFKERNGVRSGCQHRELSGRWAVEMRVRRGSGSLSGKEWKNTGR